MEKKTKKFKVPETYVLVVAFIVIATIMTYLIPAGQYDMIKNEELGTSVAEPNSFHYVEQNPSTLMDFLLAIPKGLNKSASIINLIFLVTGFFQIVSDTGAIDRIVGVIIKKLERNSILVIPIITIIMSILGALGAITNAVIAFIPLGIVIAKKLKLDPVVAVAIMFVGTYCGFGSSPIYPTTLQLAQKIADVPVLSGFNFRVIMWIILTLTTTFYIMRYAKKIQIDINNSILDKVEFSDNLDESLTNSQFSVKDIAIIVVLILGFVIFTYGTLNYGWGTDYMCAIMFAIALIAGIIAKVHPEKMSESFINGCKSVVYASLITGFATGISVILTEGNIIHTIVYTLSIPLNKVGAIISSWLMLYINMFFNLLVPSGSGQAAVVMPLMAPLSDIIDMSRQVAVCAYQYGDLITNLFIPTSGTVMAVIAIAKVPYGKWFKFIVPLCIIWMIIIHIALVYVIKFGI
ncbi:MAG: TIGR00366 family protein [Tissierellia bacterium]|nr:TIGR00366 family protein [Tissierellia bacterium]MDD4781746.1 TIGR00366 family protein [Tissierellia bacterium]